MGNRWIRPLAVGISLTLHAALFVQFSGLQQPQAAVSEQARLAEIRLAIMQPAPSEPTQPAEAQPPVPEPEKPREAPRKPSPKKIAKPKPVEQQSEPQPTPPPVVAAAATPDKAVVEDLRRSYIARVMALIEAHKFYPSAARRRRIEGDVRMTMQVDADGRPCHVESSGAPDVLIRAARDSLDATPLPAPPPGLELPVSFDFIIKYRLG